MQARLTFVTGNENKIREFKEIFGETEAIAFASVDLPEFQGEPESIAREKCKIASQLVNGPVIVEDTCLCFEALGGLPGPYVKWFLQKIGPSGLVKLLAAFDNRRAYAQCIFSYTESAGSAPILFIGKTQGLIVEEARGTARFGWDSIFEPEGFSKTYAEMTAEEKNSISHRRRSMDQLKAFLRDSLKIIS